MTVIAATPSIGTLEKAPIPVTAVAIPAEKRAEVTAPKPIAAVWVMVKAFFIFFFAAEVINLALQFVLYLKYFLEAEGIGRCWKCRYWWVKVFCLAVFQS